MLDTGSQNDQFNAAVQRVAELAQEFENLPYPNLQDKAADLLQAVDTLHRTALARLTVIIRDEGHTDLLDKLSEDPLVRQLFLLYDLVPGDDRTLVEAALYPYASYARAHGGDIEVLDVADGIVRLRLSGACLGCSSSTTSLSRAIEQTLGREFPGFRSLVIQEEDPPAHLTSALHPEASRRACA